ncbi:terminal uridylyltransferase Tailor-like isoform X2 [Drosophila nasuta]|uniref:terminal uridylyltransferase Tailor-like isoform X2 n=1 Tax=Drosophila nasuta TaxID=42062 RepID=UPI00295EE8F0|nr:terminal uridylyltransferase Tailor-like isoform X2 [Drosophila nasuta]
MRGQILMFVLKLNIMRIKNAIKSDANWKFLEMLDGKCHVIRAVSVPMNLQYDINCSGDLAYCKNKLVKYIFDLQPIARYMVIYLRDWTNKHNLSGSFRSHIIVKMVIYFLQVAKFLPGIQHFLKNQLITSEDCDIDFIELKLSSFNMSKIIVNETETREILIKFFQYYSNFSFSYYTICPYLGFEVSTSSLSTKMPKSFTNPYFYRDAVVMQDMFYLNCNKAKPIKPCSVEHFKAACRKSVV